LIYLNEECLQKKFRNVKKNSQRQRRYDDVMVVANHDVITDQVNSILRHVAELLQYDNDKLEDLYSRTAWTYEDKTKVLGSAYEMFKKAAL